MRGGEGFEAMGAKWICAVEAYSKVRPGRGLLGLQQVEPCTVEARMRV